MISIVQQTIDFYQKHKKSPALSDLQIENLNQTNERGSCFVTLYKNGEICGSAWNIEKIKNSILLEIVENTISAIEDSRFPETKTTKSSDIKIRIDTITQRSVLQDNNLEKLDPSKQGVLAIKKDYSAMATVLPNIHPSLLTWSDFAPILASKFATKQFIESEYILYSLETVIDRNF